ncbi:hypothetical protein C8Q78DRAFT_994880 [Trametes maxima]|nr:hypothetical protein C8Q78DRAFT_994880 [Trametes maxima]
MGFKRPRPTCARFERVLNALAVIARNKHSSVSLSDLVEKVKDSIVLDLLPLNSGVKARVLKALKVERLARRIKLVQGQRGAVMLYLTPYGLRYFWTYGAVVVYEKDEAMFQRLTIKELRKETRALDSVLLEIRDILREYHPRYSSLSNVEDIPDIVTEVIKKTDTLGEQYTELTSMLAKERAEERALLSSRLT